MVISDSVNVLVCLRARYLDLFRRYLDLFLLKKISKFLLLHYNTECDVEVLCFYGALCV